MRKNEVFVCGNEMMSDAEQARWIHFACFAFALGRLASEDPTKCLRPFWPGIDDRDEQ
jgi:hypothetical protein